MGLSFHDQSSLAEAVSSLRFNDEPNPILGTGINDPNAVNISQEGREDDISGCDDIQIHIDEPVVPKAYSSNEIL